MADLSWRIGVLKRQQRKLFKLYAQETNHVQLERLVALVRSLERELSRLELQLKIERKLYG